MFGEHATGSILSEGLGRLYEGSMAMPLFISIQERGGWDWAGRVGKRTAKLRRCCRKLFWIFCFLKRVQ